MFPLFFPVPSPSPPHPFPPLPLTPPLPPPIPPHPSPPSHPKVVHVCVGSTRLVHTLSWPRKIRQSKVLLRGTVPGQDTCVDCVFLSTTAFASLSSCGVVRGMKFVLVPSHPPSSPLSPSPLTPQKRTIEQGTTLLGSQCFYKLIFVHWGVQVQMPMLMLSL